MNYRKELAELQRRRDAQVVADYLAGYSLSQTARRVGISHRMVDEILTWHEIEKRPRGHRNRVSEAAE